MSDWEAKVMKVLVELGCLSGSKEASDRLLELTGLIAAVATQPETAMLRALAEGTPRPADYGFDSARWNWVAANGATVERKAMDDGTERWVVYIPDHGRIVDLADGCGGPRHAVDLAMERPARREAKRKP